MFWDFLDFSQIAMRGGVWRDLHTLQSGDFPKQAEHHKKHSFSTETNPMPQSRGAPRGNMSRHSNPRYFSKKKLRATQQPEERSDRLKHSTGK